MTHDTSEKEPAAKRPVESEDQLQHARDREMGRDGEPLGDLGEKGKTWTPPKGEQGFSNRADDEAEQDKPA